MNTLDIINRQMRCEEVETRADVLFELAFKKQEERDN